MKRRIVALVAMTVFSGGALGDTELEERQAGCDFVSERIFAGARTMLENNIKTARDYSLYEQKAEKKSSYVTAEFFYNIGRVIVDDPRYSILTPDNLKARIYQDCMDHKFSPQRLFDPVSSKP